MSRHGVVGSVEGYEPAIVAAPEVVSGVAVISEEITFGAFEASFQPLAFPIFHAQASSRLLEVLEVPAHLVPVHVVAPVDVLRFFVAGTAADAAVAAVAQVAFVVHDDSHAVGSSAYSPD